jgi:hypothetical protein
VVSPAARLFLGFDIGSDRMGLENMLTDPLSEDGVWDRLHVHLDIELLSIAID